MKKLITKFEDFKTENIKEKKSNKEESNDRPIILRGDDVTIENNGEILHGKILSHNPNTGIGVISFNPNDIEEINNEIYRRNNENK